MRLYDNVSGVQGFNASVGGIGIQALSAERQKFDSESFNASVGGIGIQAALPAPL